MPNNPHSFFLLIALFFGTLLVFFTPPFQSPDEHNHFFRAWQISEGKFFPEKTKENRLGGVLPESLIRLQQRFGYLKNNYDARVSWAQIRQELGTPLEPDRRIFIDFPNTAIYAPPAYLPQAFGIACMRALNAPALWTVYAGRLCNLLVWTWLVWSALRLLPFLRWGMAALALLPSSMAIAASLNPDVLVNGLCFWLVAFFVADTAREERLTKTGRAAAALAVIAMNKIVFAPFVLLEFLGWKRHSLSDYRTRLRGALLLGAVATGLASWAPLAKNLFIPYEHYHPAYRDAVTLNEGVDPDAQMQWMKEHPAAFTDIVLYAYLRSAPSTTAHMLGKFGWEKNYLPTWMLGLLGLAPALLLCAETIPWNWRQRGIALLTVAACLLLFSVTMYALWHPVGAPELSNLQGRYFFPVLPLLFMALANGALHRFKTHILTFTTSALILGNIVMLSEVYLRYWQAL